MSKTQTVVSVVVPAYNVEHFVGAALTSVLQQPRASEIELIVVDDGSTDRTLDRIREVQATHPGSRIEVLTQPNRGVSAARNAGIARATSPYIGFLDSDDVWDAGFAEKVLPVLGAGLADIVEFNVGIVDADGVLIDRMSLVSPASRGLRACTLPELMNFAHDCEAFPVARVYRRELWTDVQFPVGRVYEDLSTIPLIYTRAGSLHRLPDYLYYYRRRAGSITQGATAHTVQCLALCAQEALEHCDGGAHDVFWLAIFSKAFRYACVQASRVMTAEFARAMMTVDRIAARYRALAAHKPAGTFPPLLYRRQLFVDRRVHLAKKLVKHAFGLHLRAPTRAPRSIQP